VSGLELRPEQQQVVDDVGAAFRAGHRRVMVSAACGFGKTELATAMLKAAKNNNKRSAFVADRISLVNQTSERFDKYDLPHGVMQGDSPRFQPSQLVQVCSVQTVRRRGWPEAELIVVDEAHVLHGAMRAKLAMKDTFAIGLSATAVTPGLGKYFDVVVNAPTTNRLIERGLLVPLRIFSCTEPNMDGAKVGLGGEWDKDDAGKRALEVVGDVVQEYIRHGANKKFIGFAASIAHAEELQRQFLAAGINVATYTADDKSEDRNDIVREFRKPNSSIRGVLSVEALTRGFDVADVEVLILARPLRKSLAVHVQMLGRVMRTAPGKDQALVLDHSGNCARFWDAWNDLFENGVRELDDGKRKKKKEASDKPAAEPMRCPSCSALHKPMPFCPSCGHEYPKRAAAVAHVPGTLKEIVATGDQSLMRKKLWPQVCWVVMHDRRPKDAEHAQRMAQAIYAGLTGKTAQARVETTTLEVPTTELRNKLKADHIRWVRGQMQRNAQPKARSAAEARA
jgi:superfamily II DNA or RNA helicase